MLGLPCKFACGKSFSNPLELYQHQDNCQNNEANVYEESLVSDTNEQDQSMLINGLNGSGSNGNLNASNSSGDERKVRVRTLISDEQLAVLKSFYHKNPRPKREELERISAKIGHPFKVVKVWFQNSRARDRREGKPVLHPSGGHLPSGFFNNGADGSNFPAGNSHIGLAASGLFPRLPLLGPLMNGGHALEATHHHKNSLSPRSEAKSPYSMTSDSEVVVSKPAGNSDFSFYIFFISRLFFATCYAVYMY